MKLNKNEIVQAVNQQHEYFAAGKTQPINFRLQQLKKLKKAIKAYESELLQALYQDMRKPRYEAYLAEIYLVLEELKYAIKNIRNWSSPRKIKTPGILFPAISYIQPEPLGIALIMAPWNYPIQLLLTPLVGALAAGNCAMLKPSEHAPHASSVIANMVNDFFDPAYVRVIQGGIEQAQALLEQKFDYIFFTGSTRVGSIVMKAASQHLTPLTLELGGKSPCIVDKDTSIDCTAKRIVWGKFLNAGQNCISPDYVLVHENIEDKFIEKLKHWVVSFYGNDPEQCQSYGRIITPDQFNRLKKYLSDGEIVIGGQTNASDLYIAPTIMKNINLKAPIMQEEIFGPILPIIPYNKIEDALKIILSKPKPLSLYFFSHNKTLQQKILINISSGGVAINDTLVQSCSPQLPFGGVEVSGFGKYHGKASFDTFSNLKSIFKNKLWFDLPFRYPPYGKIHEWFKRFLNWRTK